LSTGKNGRLRKPSRKLPTPQRCIHTAESQTLKILTLTVSENIAAVLRIRIRKGSVFVGLLTQDPDPYSEYISGSRCSILPDIFFKKSYFLTKIHIFKFNLFSCKKTKFLSVKDGLNTKKVILKINKKFNAKINTENPDPDPNKFKNA